MELSPRLEQEWELHRPAVFGAAYRLLGSVAEAEDVVQEVWLRAAGADDLARVADLRAWLITVAARTSYNVLKSARVRREDYVGPWLPEPLLTGPDAAGPVLVDESVGTAMMVVMRELAPPERVAFVLHDVFGLPFERIAEVLGRSVPAARKLASRARGRVAAARGREPEIARGERERVVAAFRAASQAGDLARLVAVLDPDVVYVADGGGRTKAARVPVRGRDRLAPMLAWIEGRRPAERIEPIEVGGQPALITYRDGVPAWVDTFEIRDGRVVTIWRVVNPEKIRHLGHL
ncbi:RNA polymerase sigma-70 factor (ECF subfamily) [Nonomuraea thailandensis]|uniref:RNA polymerase sigma-70 factor (ECF subfamily) n=1 Tax=Nonomuraea thailandensis TaxID=1188745 RepID=A0A9X2JZU9_9ACTN|nr:RNA polymerase sigma factor SigJ [Nonomuraea thailandensis]MCP2355657.1 RNA polymerase sigma-70 factor (ECF subfamily) [Nonomuraea thailandensis]